MPYDNATMHTIGSFCDWATFVVLAHNITDYSIIDSLAYCIAQKQITVGTAETIALKVWGF